MKIYVIFLSKTAYLYIWPAKFFMVTSPKMEVLKPPLCVKLSQNAICIYHRVRYAIFIGRIVVDSTAAIRWLRWLITWWRRSSPDVQSQDERVNGELCFEWLWRRRDRARVKATMNGSKERGPARRCTARPGPATSHTILLVFTSRNFHRP